jgi:hypothetical protein
MCLILPHDSGTVSTDYGKILAISRCTILWLALVAFDCEALMRRS